MNIKKQMLVLAISLITSCIGYVYANDPLQKFRDRIDNMPIEQRIDFYNNAITMLQKIQNNPAATKILQTMIKKQNAILNQSNLEEIQYIPKVDYTIVRTKWLEKHNTARAKQWINDLESNYKLNKTAQTWANYLAENNIPSGSTHKRNKTDSYYDYNKILNRFESQNVLFIDTGSTAFSENIGYGYYKACTSDDCTEKLLHATQSTRDFFIGEYSRNWPHYRALMSTNFGQIGIGIARNQNTKRYYVVVHYWLQTTE